MTFTSDRFLSFAFGNICFSLSCRPEATFRERPSDVHRSGLHDVMIMHFALASCSEDLSGDGNELERSEIKHAESLDLR